MRLRTAFLSIGCWTLYVSLCAPAQAVQQDARAPRVALVLSGGGARGLAHVGVLQALEELRVPVDLVVGSEWGALIGGLYAAGLSPAEIQTALVSTDWIDALEDRTPRQFLNYRAKQDDRDFLVDLPLGIGSRGVILPPGLLNGSRLRLELARLTMGRLGIERFDELPIPFRAVATDLDHGQAVSLDRGSLARAIEASLSTPVLYPPVPWEGRRLTSGAISDQIPVDVAIALGAQTLIVVDVSDSGADSSPLNFLGVGERVLDLLGEKRSREARASLREQDVLCVPDVEGVNLADYELAPETVERGRAAALALKDRLAILALEPAAFEERLRLRRERAGPLPVLHGVRVQEDCPLAAESMRARMESREGERLDAEVVGFDLARLYGLRIFQRVDFDLERTEADQADLLVRTEPSPTAPLHWRLGLAGELTAGDDVNFVVGGSVRYSPSDDWGSEWRAQAEVGNRFRFAVEHRHALDPRGEWYLVPRGSWEKRPVQVDEGASGVAQFSVEQVELGLDLVRELGDAWEARAGLVYRAGESRLEIGNPALGGSDSFQGGGVALGLACDTLDDIDFPRRGSLLRAEWFLPVDEFEKGQDETVRVRLDHALEVGDDALVLGGEVSTVVGENGSVQSFFPLGGFLRLSGLRADEINGPTAVLARSVYLRPLSSRGLERKAFSWYAGLSLELGNVFDDFDAVKGDELLASGSIFLAVDTIFGPGYVGYGLTEGGESSVFFVIGRQF